MQSNTVLIPSIFRRIWPMLIWVILVLIVTIFINIDDNSTMGRLLSNGLGGLIKVVALIVFMTSSIFWVFYAASDHDAQRDRFLVTLPISRREVVRYPTRFFLLYFSTLTGIFLSIAAALKVIGYAATRDLLEVLLICIWFPIITMFGYLISRAVKYPLLKMLFMILALMGCMGPIMNFVQIQETQTIKQFLGTMGLIGVVILAISIAAIYHYEKEFIEKELV